MHFLGKLGVGLKLVALIGVVLWSFMLRPYCAYPGLVKGFIANQGQYDERIQFYTSIGNSEIFILSDGMVLKSSKSLNHNNQVETDYFGYMNADQDSVQFRKKIVCVKVEFEDSKEEPIILVNGRMSAKVNYIKGDLFSDWFINVPVYKIVEYEDVWPGINILFEYRESGINVKLKYTHNSDITNVRFNILDHGILDQHCESSIILRIEDLDDILSYFGQQGFDLNIDFNINDFIGISNKRINTEKMLLPGNIVWSTYFGSNEWKYGNYFY